MRENAELKKSESSGGTRRRRYGMVAAIQYVLFVALGVTMFVALFYDSRLYYGIDVNGQPIYRESRLAQPEVFDLSSVSADSATGIDIEGAEG